MEREKKHPFRLLSSHPLDIHKTITSQLVKHNIKLDTIERFIAVGCSPDAFKIQYNHLPVFLSVFIDLERGMVDNSKTRWAGSH